MPPLAAMMRDASSAGASTSTSGASERLAERRDAPALRGRPSPAPDRRVLPKDYFARMRAGSDRRFCHGGDVLGGLVGHWDEGRPRAPHSCSASHCAACRECSRRPKASARSSLSALQVSSGSWAVSRPEFGSQSALITRASTTEIARAGLRFTVLDTPRPAPREPTPAVRGARAHVQSQAASSSSGGMAWSRAATSLAARDEGYPGDAPTETSIATSAWPCRRPT